MDHSHDHHHHHAPTSFGRAFALGIVLNTIFVALEAGAGWYAGSMALLADAGHNLSDVLVLALAWGAALLAARRPSAHYTYGLRSTTIFAAMANAALLLVAVGAIAWEAVQRLIAPVAVHSEVVIGVALAGVVVNGATAMLFMAGRHGDLNIRGAFLHMAGDAAVSLGVVVAALLIRWTGWLWLDPAVSLAVAAAILAATWGLTRNVLNLALDAVPAGIDGGAVEAYLAELPGVTEVHDLHIWAMSTTEVALTAHLVRPGAALDDGLLAEAARELERRFGIHHVTMQIEAGDQACECRLAPNRVV